MKDVKKNNRNHNKKVVQINWSFLNETLELPVLKSGKILVVLGWTQGRGQHNGRFPHYYAIVTRDCIVEEATINRTEQKPHGWVSWNESFAEDSPTKVKLVLFKHEDKAKEVAQIWATTERTIEKC